MSIAAHRTHARQTHRQLRTISSGATVAHPENDLAHAILAAFVIDDAARAEFGEAKETRPGEEGIFADTFLARWHERHERQTREVIAGQEALAGKIAVGIEVGVGRGRGLQQQVLLRLGFSIAPVSLTAILL